MRAPILDSFMLEDCVVRGCIGDIGDQVNTFAAKGTS